jgi:hypothetical protein
LWWGTKRYLCPSRAYGLVPLWALFIALRPLFPSQPAPSSRQMVESADTEDAGPSGGADVSRESGEMLKHMHKRGAVSSSTGQRPSWAELTACEDQVKPEVSGRAFAPILVSCSGSDEGDSSSGQLGGPAESSAGEGVLQQHNSITSTLDGMESANYRSLTSCKAVPACKISEADVQAGCFITGVRYCLETRPSFILRVGPTAAVSAALV